MNAATVSCNVLPDRNDVITGWVCRNLGFDCRDMGEHRTLGFFAGGKLIGGLVYHNIRIGRDLWWTIYTTDKRWCNRRVLRKIFGLAFDYWQVERISLLIDTDNRKCLKLAKKLGFRREGLMRKFRDDGRDCYFYGLLKSENKWKGKNNE